MSEYQVTDYSIGVFAMRVDIETKTFRTIDERAAFLKKLQEFVEKYND